jgi:hypothetical protein
MQCVTRPNGVIGITVGALSSRYLRQDHLRVGGCGGRQRVQTLKW